MGFVESVNELRKWVWKTGSVDFQQDDLTWRVKKQLGIRLGNRLSGNKAAVKNMVLWKAFAVSRPFHK